MRFFALHIGDKCYSSFSSSYLFMEDRSESVHHFPPVYAKEKFWILQNGTKRKSSLPDDVSQVKPPHFL